MDVITSKKHQDISISPDDAPDWCSTDDCKVKYAEAFLTMLENRRDNIIDTAEKVVALLSNPDPTVVMVAHEYLKRLDVSTKKTDSGWEYKLGNLR